MYRKSTDNNTMSFGELDPAIANLSSLHLLQVFWEINYRYNEPCFLSLILFLSFPSSPEETINLNLVFNSHMNILYYLQIHEWQIVLFRMFIKFISTVCCKKYTLQTAFVILRFINISTQRSSSFIFITQQYFIVWL